MYTVDYVLGFAFSDDLSQVLLINKLTPSWQAGYLNGIGGKIEEEEYASDAMVREFKEETGIVTETSQWTPVGRLYSDCEFVVHLFCIKTDEISTFTQLEEEVPEIIDSTTFYQRNCLPNLGVLVPACKLILSGAEDFVLDMKY